MDSLVSIIVPVYNMEKYLDRCIKSLTEQTYQLLEIILIDDASIDHSREICSKWAEKDSRVKVHSFSQHAGPGAARTFGIKMASAQYLMFVDSDDFLPLTAVQELIERLLQDGSDIVQGKRKHIWEDGSTMDEERTWMQDSVLSPAELFAIEGLEPGRRCACEFWGKLYKKEVLDGIVCPAIKYGEDLWVYPEIISKCKKISIIDSTVYFYFERNDSVTKAPSLEAQLSNLEANLRYMLFLHQNGFQEGAKKYLLISIAIAFSIKDIKNRSRLYNAYCVDQKELLKGVSLKVYLKHLSVKNQCFGRVMEFLKEIKEKI